MADASRFPNSPDSNRSGWADAFAALPLDAPAASRWPDVAAQLDTRRELRTQRVRMRTGLALAAALFALAALPAVWLLHDARTDTGRTAPSAASKRLSPVMLPTGDAAAPDAIAPRTDRASPATGAVDSRLAENSRATHSRATTRVATATRARRHAARERRLTAAQPASAASNPGDSVESLESLYAASAQLETLLAFARDTRVDSAPAASLAGAFDAELAVIDARLAQPGLDAGEQRRLWRARVEALQRSAGFESHLRLLAADGERLDGALVSVN